MSDLPETANKEKLFAEGVRLFNQQSYFEAHEAWEEIWTESRDPARQFVQALIHFAVGLHHLGRGNRTGAARQLRKGLAKCEGFRPSWAGVELDALADAVEDVLGERKRRKQVQVLWSEQRLSSEDGWLILGDSPPPMRR